MHWRRKLATHSSVLAWKSQGREAWWAAVYGSHRVGHDWSDLAIFTCVISFTNCFLIMITLYFQEFLYIYIILFFPYVFFSPFFSDSLWYFFLSLLICFLYSHLLFSSPFGFSPIFFFQPLFMLFSPVFLPSLIFYIFSWICYDLSLAFLFYWIKIMASVS